MYVSISMCTVNDHVNCTVYTIDRFHIQCYLYPMLDLWNILYINYQLDALIIMRVGTLIVATIYLQLIQNRYMF